MAKDVITRFKLESTQYDSKIKNAAKELSDVAKAAKSAGSDFERFTKDQLAAARALGTIATSSTNAKDKAKELVGAFNDVARSYNQLTDAQKKSDFGKAVADSLTTLQQRIRETKQEMQSMESKSGGLFGGDKLIGMLQVMGGNLMTKGVTIAAGAVTSMVNEIGDAVKQGIELAKQGEGIRIAFERLGRGDILQGLREATHGTVTDLELMKAAVKFNDFKLPVEELGTMLAFAQQKAKDTGQSVDYMVDSIVTGLGRKSLMILDNLGLSATEVKEKMKETGDMTKAVGEIIREQMAKAGDYVETAADRAAQANVSLQNKMEELGRKFAPLEEASNQLWTSMKIGILDIVGGPLAELLNGLTEAGRLRNAYGKMGGSGKVRRMTANLAGASEQNRQSMYQQQQQQFWKYINPREQQIRDIRAWQSGQRGEDLQVRIGAIRDKYGSLDATKIQAEVDAAKKMLADYQSAAKQILQPIKQEITPVVTTKGGTTKSGTTKTEQTELQQNQAEINRLTQEYVRLGDMSTQSAEERKAAIQDEIEKLKERNGLLQKYAAQAEGRQLLTGSDISTKGLGNFSETMNPLAADNRQMATGGVLKLKLDDKFIEDFNRTMVEAMNKKNDRDVFDDSKKLVSGLNQVAGGLQQMGVKLPTEVQQVIGVINGAMTVIEGVNTVLSLFSSSVLTANTMAITANTAALWAVAATNLIPGFAGGGIVPHAASGYMVPGTHFSGDVTPIMANAGELVLNRAQVGNLASQLQNTGMGPMSFTLKAAGEQLIAVIDRTGKRKGMGELMWWK